MRTGVAEWKLILSRKKAGGAKEQFWTGMLSVQFLGITQKEVIVPNPKKFACQTVLRELEVWAQPPRWRDKLSSRVVLLRKQLKAQSVIRESEIVRQGLGALAEHIR